MVSILIGHHGYSDIGLAESVAQHRFDLRNVQAWVENILATHPDSWGTHLPGLPAPWQQFDFTAADLDGDEIPFSTIPDSPIARFLAFWQLDRACGHYLQALTPDTRLTVMLRFYPAADTRNINGSFRSFADNVAAASDQLLGKDELTARVKRARKQPSGNSQWRSFCSLLRLKRDPDRHCAQTLLCFLSAVDVS